MAAQIHAGGDRYTTAKNLPLLPSDDDPRLVAAPRQGDGLSVRRQQLDFYLDQRWW
jgi:hypothetical protein